MRCTDISTLLVVSIIMQMIASLDTTMGNPLNERQEDNGQSKISVRYKSFPTDKQLMNADCLSKTELVALMNRDRRASISRPYFHQWRPARENGRYPNKNSLAFSPRLGRQENSNDASFQVSESDFNTRSINNIDEFLNSLMDHLKTKGVDDRIYEDESTICWSPSIGKNLVQDMWDKFQKEKRQAEQTEKEDSRCKSVVAKHPVLFRYRLG